MNKKAVAILVWFIGAGEKKIMLTKRRRACGTFVNYYAAVGGSVEDEECGLSAAVREMKEETGYFAFKSQFKLIDCYNENGCKCFIFELGLPLYHFRDMKNTEPNKHTAWKLYTIEKALVLPKLMPAIREILLTNTQKSA